MQGLQAQEYWELTFDFQFASMAVHTPVVADGQTVELGPQTFYSYTLQASDVTASLGSRVEIMLDACDATQNTCGATTYDDGWVTVNPTRLDRKFGRLVVEQWAGQLGMAYPYLSFTGYCRGVGTGIPEAVSDAVPF